MNLMNSVGEKFKVVGLAFTLSICFLSACKTVPQEYRAFIKLSPDQRREEMRKLPPDKQLDYYFAGLDYIHPPDVGLADPIAEKGKKVLPFLLERINNEKDEGKKADMISILENMHLSHYNLRMEGEVISLLKETTAGAKTQRLKGKGEEALSLIMEGKIPDPVKLLDQIGKEAK